MSTDKFRKFTRFIGVFLLIFILSPGFFKMIISAENIFIKMQIFNLILNEIQKSYIEEVDPIELMEDAIKGMLSNLDPHTTYLPREQYETWHKKFDGFGGIGIYYDIIQGYVTVTSVIEDSPAEAAGLHPNDKIIGINGEKMVGIKDDVISEKIKGEEGAQVVLLVSRDDWKTPREFKLTLRRIFISSVPDAYLLTPEIGYIYLAKFTATTTAELKTAVENLQKIGMQKLILDLRNNGGGLMHAAVDVADLFLPGKRKIVFKKGRSQSSYEAFFSSGNAPFANLPLLILINHATASSSEIVAGAIQDWDRGLIVGESSFGKGLVQSQIRFADNSALLITTARYFTPSGRLIQRDFHHKSKIEYYQEAYNDTLRNFARQDTQHAEIYQSMQGRKLFACGGISPDIPVAADSEQVSLEIQKLYYFSRTQKPVFARFAEDFLAASTSQAHRLDPSDRNQLVRYIRDFKLLESDWQHFRSILEEVQFPLTNEQFLANQADIEFLILREVCFRVWGEYGRFMVRLTRDHQLKLALGCFPESERLLETSLELYQNYTGNFQAY